MKRIAANLLRVDYAIRQTEIRSETPAATAETVAAAMRSASDHTGVVSTRPARIWNVLGSTPDQGADPGRLSSHDWMGRVVVATTYAWGRT